MKAYKNLGGNSGISSYQIFENAIDIEFRSGRIYTYTKQNLGEVNFEIMKALAEAGAGLCAFIQKVRDAYSESVDNGKPTKAEVDAAILNLQSLITAYRS